MSTAMHRKNRRVTRNMFEQLLDGGFYHIVDAENVRRSQKYTTFTAFSKKRLEEMACFVIVHEGNLEFEARTWTDLALLMGLTGGGR